MQGFKIFFRVEKSRTFWIYKSKVPPQKMKVTILTIMMGFEGPRLNKCGHTKMSRLNIVVDTVLLLSVYMTQFTQA